jgi:hypothetical protein
VAAFVSRLRGIHALRDALRLGIRLSKGYLASAGGLGAAQLEELVFDTSGNLTPRRMTASQRP